MARHDALGFTYHATSKSWECDGCGCLVVDRVKHSSACAYVQVLTTDPETDPYTQYAAEVEKQHG